MAMFNVGDEVESGLFGYKGVVVGYHPDLPRMVRIERFDGVEGHAGPFWQTNESDVTLISATSLINE